MFKWFSGTHPSSDSASSLLSAEGKSQSFWKAFIAAVNSRDSDETYNFVYGCQKKLLQTMHLEYGSPLIYAIHQNCYDICDLMINVKFIGEDEANRTVTMNGIQVTAIDVLLKACEVQITSINIDSLSKRDLSDSLTLLKIAGLVYRHTRSPKRAELLSVIERLGPLVKTDAHSPTKGHSATFSSSTPSPIGGKSPDTAVVCYDTSSLAAGAASSPIVKPTGPF